MRDMSYTRVCTPEAPSTQDLRTLVLKNHTLNGFWGAESLNLGYLDPLGTNLRVTTPRMPRSASAPEQKRACIKKHKTLEVLRRHPWGRNPVTWGVQKYCHADGSGTSKAISVYAAKFGINKPSQGT